ncbi:hypothetical protein SEA_MANEEKUL_44 [Streptomyces phage Maneekul]|uniref:Uncharacterized protein n=1 Tax=Streptomyces phage Yasdnil TaxID=2593360 RepID=A0A514U486_9CAUD|nr:hypothetical protein KGG98_gp44 [Streptomyces phage Yasdnil]AWN07412.1 hypothetical protein SEA_MANEEKUL_44 [Streptomyces phage Maneekul]QDK03768.1 hypothetical protein SEA_YASDNIL_44 [Streptomyces phage Yasdnil]
MKIIEITNAYESAEEARADWELATSYEGSEAAHSAAVRFARDYEGVAEFEDMKQEALLILATRGHEYRRALDFTESPIGVMTHRLYCDLRDKFVTRLKHQRKNTSFEAEQEKFNSEVA